MKKALWILTLFLTGCFSHSSLVTRCQYDEVQMGSSITQVQKALGKPYAVYDKGDKTEYEYVEKIDRFDRDDNFTLENHYFIIVSGGKVVGKRMTVKQPPPYRLLYQEDPNNFDY